METKDFDNWFKEASKEKNYLHLEDMEGSQKKVWNAIQKDLPKAPFKFKNYWAAAAVLIILFGLGSLFYVQLEQNHQEKIELLRAELKEIQIEDIEQVQELEEKELELLQIRNELIQIKEEMQTIQSIEKQSPQYLVKETILRDTIYIQQIQYKAIETKPLVSGVEEVAFNSNDIEIGAEAESDEKRIKNDLIYPSAIKPKKTNKVPSALTLKVGPFTAN